MPAVALTTFWHYVRLCLSLWHAAGKKDTPIDIVQADSYAPDYIPAEVNRIARILAGRKQAEDKLQLSAGKAPFRSFAAQA